MRHDEHYVEALAASAGTPIGRMVSIEQIDPNPNQPRQVMGDLSELMASIAEKGIIEPLIVRQRGDRFQIVAGERRYQAAVQVGLRELPVVISDADEAEMLELALIENLQRENLNPVEEARAFKRLGDEFHLSQEDIATRVGKTRSAVTNSIRLLQLPPSVLAQLESGELSAGHGRSLLGLDSPAAQTALAKDAAARRLSVRDTEKLVRDRQTSADDVERRAVEADLARALGTRVHVKHHTDNSGRIIIEYFSLDELDGLLTRLGAR